MFFVVFPKIDYGDKIYIAKINVIELIDSQSLFICNIRLIRKSYTNF